MTAQRAIQDSAEDLQQKFNEHMLLLCVAFSEGIADGKVNVYCRSECFYRFRFRETLTRVIRTLESTRKAFKSKQLEALRKELLMVLADDDTCVEALTTDHE